jgi:hypothetical protein
VILLGQTFKNIHGHAPIIVEYSRYLAFGLIGLSKLATPLVVSLHPSRSNNFYNYLVETVWAVCKTFWPRTLSSWCHFKRISNDVQFWWWKNLLHVKIKSHYNLPLRTEFPVSLSLHVNLSPQEHLADLLTDFIYIGLILYLLNSNYRRKNACLTQMYLCDRLTHLCILNLRLCTDLNYHAFIKKNVYKSPEGIFRKSVWRYTSQMCQIFVRKGKPLLLFGREGWAALVGLLFESS